MKNFDFKKALPYVAAIAIFLVITIVYFSPLLEGKKIVQSDIIHFKGASKEIADFRDKTGQEALWTNSMFGGMPAFQISTRYTGNLVGYLDTVMTLGLPHPANMVFLYFFGFFILLLVMRIDPWLSVAGAVGFALSSFFFIIIDAGHNSQAVAIGYMAPVMAGIVLTMRRKYLAGGLLTAIFLSLEVKANHPQITYYLAMIILLYGIFKLADALKQKELPGFLKSVGVLTIALTFAALTNISTLWATWEYGQYTIRGKTELTTEKENRTSGLDKDYATQWSYGRGETMTLLIPRYYGGSSNEKVNTSSKIAEAMRANNIPEGSISEYLSQPLPFLYWGDQLFTSGPVYAGAVIMFLFILGLLVVKGPEKWWLLTATVLSILLAWGHNFMAFTDFFLTYLPGYNKFRAVSMTLVIAEFCIPLLAVLAVKAISENPDGPKTVFRPVLIALGITGGLALLFAAVPGALLNFTSANDAAMAQQYQLPDWMMQGIRAERERVLRLDALRSLGFILMGAFILWSMVFGKVQKKYAFMALAVVILIDMFPINKRYLSNDSFTSATKAESPFEPSPADLEILKDQSLDYRVLNLTTSTFMDANTSYFHKSLGGYHGAKLRRYQELIEAGIQPDIQAFAGSMSTDSTPVLNMLNTRYFILPGNDRQPMAYPNPNAAGNAWFVGEAKQVANADEELAAIRKFDPRNTAIVDKTFADLLGAAVPERDSTDAIALKSYKPNELEYLYNSRNGGLAVFSEIYYPKGWDAYIDGKPAPHFRANYVLRAMMLPAGNHTITFKFEPAAYSVGEKISRYSSILLIVLAVAFVVNGIRSSLKAKA